MVTEFQCIEAAASPEVESACVLGRRYGCGVINDLDAQVCCLAPATHLWHLQSQCSCKGSRSTAGHVCPMRTSRFDDASDFCSTRMDCCCKFPGTMVCNAITKT